LEAEPFQTELVHDEFLGKPCFKRAAGGFSLTHWIADKWGNQVRPHGHIDPHFVFVTGGHYVSTATAEPGRGRSQLVYNPPNTFHRDRFESRPASFFTISATAELILEACEVSLPRVPTQIGHAAAHTIVRKLMRECPQWQPDSALLIESLCFELISAIGSPLEVDHRNAPIWLKAVRDMLQDGYANEIRIKDISRLVGVHPIHVTRTFRAFYGCTPGDFLRVCRTQRAAELLTSTRLTLVEVALESGFADQSHLTRHLRRHYGISPGRYRRLIAPHR